MVKTTPEEEDDDIIFLEEIRHATVLQTATVTPKKEATVTQDTGNKIKKEVEEDIIAMEHVQNCTVSSSSTVILKNDTKVSSSSTVIPKNEATVSSSATVTQKAGKKVKKESEVKDTVFAQRVIKKEPDVVTPQAPPNSVKIEKDDEIHVLSALLNVQMPPSVQPSESILVELKRFREEAEKKRKAVQKSINKQLRKLAELDAFGANVSRLRPTPIPPARPYFLPDRPKREPVEPQRQASIEDQPQTSSSYRTFPDRPSRSSRTVDSYLPERSKRDLVEPRRHRDRPQTSNSYRSSRESETVDSCYSEHSRREQPPSRRRSHDQKEETVPRGKRNRKEVTVEKDKVKEDVDMKPDVKKMRISFY